MPTQRNARRLVFLSIAALVLTVAGAATAGYAWFSTRVTRWGDQLIVGPKFTGEAILDGGATRIGVSWENGSPALDVPSWKGRGPFYMTFIGGFAIYHTPPGAMPGGKVPAPLIRALFRGFEAELVPLLCRFRPAQAQLLPGALVRPQLLQDAPDRRGAFSQAG